VSQLVELREKALAAVMIARDFVASHPMASTANQKEVDALYADAIRAIAPYEAASGTTRPRVVSEDVGQRLDQLSAWLGGPGAPRSGGMGNGIPYPAGAGGLGGAYSWGQAFIEARQARSGGIAFGAQLLETGSTAVTVPLRSEPIVDPRRARFIFELLAEQPAPNGQYAYMQQTLRELNAAVVEPGARKPQSIFRMEKVPDHTKVIAHVTEPIDRFNIEDAPMLRTFIDGELALGVNLALDKLVVEALLLAATPGEATLDLSGIRTAITSLQLLELEASAIAINPTDWQSVEEEATTFVTSDRVQNATDALARRLYGVPVVVSTGIAAGQAIVGDFSASQPASADLYVTGGVRIDVSDSIYMADAGDGNPGTTFEQNSLVFRGERRANIAIGRPAGFILVGTAAGS
jgi:hypothetical protein